METMEQEEYTHLLLLELYQSIKEIRLFIHMYSTIIHAYQDHLSLLMDKESPFPGNEKEKQKEIEEYTKRILSLYKKKHQELKDFQTNWNF